MSLPNVIYLLQLEILLDNILVWQAIDAKLFLLLAGDIESNPGPNREQGLKFCHWNLNSICARESMKIPQIEAYNTIYHYDILALSETMLNDSVESDNITIEGFSKNIFRNDQYILMLFASIIVKGYQTSVRRTLNACKKWLLLIVARKLIIFTTMYRSPTQTIEQFDGFTNGLETFVSRIQAERHYMMMLTGDFNCRSSQWWPQDVEHHEGSVLDELIGTNNLYQLVNEPTNIRNEGMPCIDLIITDQPNMFIESGVHPSLDDHCQHQIVYGKVNVFIPYPPPYNRTICEYAKYNDQEIKVAINRIDRLAHGSY